MIACSLLDRMRKSDGLETEEKALVEKVKVEFDEYHKVITSAIQLTEADLGMATMYMESTEDKFQTLNKGLTGLLDLEQKLSLGVRRYAAALISLDFSKCRCNESPAARDALQGVVHFGARLSVAARLGPIAVGAAALLFVLSWQALVVRFNYQGNWSGLFYIGDRWPLPPALASDDARVLRDDPGYDGVFYHLAAHDPWLARGFWRFADNPSLRWRRILVPALAWLAALGADSRIHAAYVAVNLLFVFLGAWWLARYSRTQGAGSLFGFGFLAVPSVLVSMDRLTVDTALAALAIGLFAFAAEGKVARSLAFLVFCPLARETGLCLTAGKALDAFRHRRWRRFFWIAASALPFLVWTGYLLRNLPRDGTPWLSWPLAGIIRRTLHPWVYPITGRGIALAAALDYLALLGIWAALFLTAHRFVTRKSGALETCAGCFAFAALWLGKADIWAGAYEFGRTMSPLLILLGLISIRDRNGWFLLPLGCVLPRVLLQLEAQILPILRHSAP